MTEPVTFDESTPRFAFPMLYAAQAQKEYFVNEALSRVDALMQCVVEGIASSEPATPQNGQNWIVANAASGAFQGQDGKIACRQQGQWLFAAPSPAMLVFDRTLGKQRRFDGEWVSAQEVELPGGGPIVDTEARAAIAALREAMVRAGILTGGQEIVS
ncbi:DUF2793 domain-containing protein [uncultured Croceicoccus sp.]|uniref:DUF2793 domain-containing protein n=1 Tax=uncultured Croceicoccus sp. TaxID=1295329 RepID=UPI00260A6390|nr:DUF2793 domain-containing protein [uncultured Croceicoccus sp.]